MKNEVIMKHQVN